mmetsp:Transcript_17179/g.51604  ORF Transcript_17179/g.51604 Transcript_17179/m.51604 type:complete len:220 (-) Transcript_17179:1883-2542(-)
MPRPAGPATRCATPPGQSRGTLASQRAWGWQRCRMGWSCPRTGHCPATQQSGHSRQHPGPRAWRTGSSRSACLGCGSSATSADGGAPGTRTSHQCHRSAGGSSTAPPQSSQTHAPTCPAPPAACCAAPLPCGTGCAGCSRRVRYSTQATTCRKPGGLVARSPTAGAPPCPTGCASAHSSAAARVTRSSAAHRATSALTAHPLRQVLQAVRQFRAHPAPR